MKLGPKQEKKFCTQDFMRLWAQVKLHDCTNASRKWRPVPGPKQWRLRDGWKALTTFKAW
ncbi:hypothetical protein DPMN_155494 [Dreissena polymorpha]|uniref:Uncharacterized protein n=1 Tax=Dreissena polymorpha TaxID=45954 RepID=A0A9D4JBF1_DREPO|nr:hypothetical protein DPMN_155494 [Dreissena polymorpha]